MEKAGAGSAYYPPSAPPLQPTTGIPVAPPYYPPQPEAPAGFHIQGGHPPHRSQWSTGLCNCCDDVGNCCITCWCPCITFGQIAEIVDRGDPTCGTSGALYGLLCALTGFQCIYSCFTRSKMRRQYGLPELPCADCLVHCCCESCALCQEYRELKGRGYDMDIGWQGNMEKWARNQTVPPTAPAGMIK